MLGCTSSKILCVQGIIPLLLEMLVLLICWKQTQHHRDWYHPSVQIWLVCSLSWTIPSCKFVLRLSAAHDTMINQLSLGTLKFFGTFCREHTHTHTSHNTTQHNKPILSFTHNFQCSRNITEKHRIWTTSNTYSFGVRIQYLCDKSPGSWWKPGWASEFSFVYLHQILRYELEGETINLCNKTCKLCVELLLLYPLRVSLFTWSQS
jgi:hypothetical protein